jgi:hypothetical protein
MVYTKKWGKVGWTEEYCGHQSLGKFSLDTTWVSVERHSNFAILNEWFPGCAFHPTETTHPTVEAAKLAGEKIMKEKNE